MISVVIPVYNAENYLDRCLSSIVSQTYRDLDIVIVDDGSSDMSPKICDKWAEKDLRINVVHQDNGGVTAARKIGVEKARGEWICFVDADDVLPIDSIDILHSNLGDSVDIIIGQISFKGDWKWPYRPMEKKLDRKQYIYKLISCKIHSGPVAKLFRRTLFDQKTFDIPREIRVGEDYIMNLRVGNSARNVKVVKKIVYEYISNSSSASAKSPFSSIKYCRDFEKELQFRKLNIPAMYKFFFYLKDRYIRRKRFVINVLRK